MPGGWTDSDRRAELPPNWASEIRPAILARDGHRCRWLHNGKRCGWKATDVDHKGDRHDHSPDNLQSLCSWHHKRKTAAEGNRTRKRLTAKRPPERHPGLR